MNTVVSLVSRHVAGVVAAKLIWHGLRAAKLRHLMLIGAGAYVFHKAFSDAPAKPAALDDLAAREIGSIDGPWRVPAPAQYDGAANGMT